MKNYSKHPFGGALTPSDVVHSKLLAANVAESFTVPTGASFVLLASTSDIFVKYFTSTQDDDRVTNGAFAADTGWTKGTGWTIATGVGTSDATQAGNSDLEQAAAATTPLIEGQAYLVTFTVTAYTAGNVRVVIGGTTGTNRASAATFSEVILAGSTQVIALRGDLDFAGSVDNFSVVPVAAVPGDNAAGSAPELLNASSTEETRTRYISGISTISVVAAGTPVVTASFFNT